MINRRFNAIVVSHVDSGSLVDLIHDPAVKDLQPLIRFLTVSNSFDEEKTDIAASLLLLKSNEKHTVRANLHVPKYLNDLPNIEREGHRSPFMDGALLGQESPITDPELQRARCLPLTKRAWLEDLAYYSGRARAAFDNLKKHLGDPETSLEEVKRSLEKRCNSMEEKFDNTWWETVRKFIVGNNAFTKTFHKPFETVDKELFWYLDHSTSLYKYRNTDVMLLHELCFILMLLRPAENVEKDDKPYVGRHFFQHLRKIPNNSSICHVVIQGAGDLSMNPWNVAYLGKDLDKPIQIYFPYGERFEEREYYCLVSWSNNAQPPEDLIDHVQRSSKGVSIGHKLRADISIVRLKFRRDSICIAGDEKSIEGSVQFALFGKIILREGKPVAPVEVVDQFLDVRHVFKLPNLNPKDSPVKAFLNSKLSENDWHEKARQMETDLNQLGAVKKVRGKPNAGLATCLDEFRKKGLREQLLVRNYSRLRHMLRERPRSIFGTSQEDDVWLLEPQLVEDPNIRARACLGAVDASLHELGPEKEWITYCLVRDGYENKNDVRDVRHRGEFAWDDTRLRVQLILNRYPCSIVGLGGKEENGTFDTLYLLAWGHEFDRGKHTIWDCAEVLRAAGARYALVIDEGLDVFQASIPGEDIVRIDGGEGKFQREEEKGGSLDRWLTVPPAFKTVEVENAEHEVKVLKRRSLRASLAFWQEADQASSKE